MPRCEKIVRNTLFSNKAANNSGYEKYRIPGIVITHKDTVLVYFEARKTSSDWAAMDIVLLRSVDGGQTFADPVCLAEGAEAGRTVNNPVMIVGNDGTIHCLYCVEYAVEQRGGGVYYRRSTDDGIHFSEPVSISEAFGCLQANVIAIGPGHGICTKAGTLLAAVWFVKRSHGKEVSSHHPASITTVFSRDNGQTWQVGEEVPHHLKDPNESALAELADGRVMLNARVPGGGCRAVSYSPSGYSGWSELALVRKLPDPTCFGSVTTRRGPEGGRQILFVNCAHESLRIRLTVKYSEDEGKTWKTLRLIRKGFAGYADIACDSKGNIYIAYEIFSGDKAALAKLYMGDN